MTYPGGHRHCQSAAYADPDRGPEHRRASCTGPCDAQDDESQKCAQHYGRGLGRLRHKHERDNR